MIISITLQTLAATTDLAVVSERDYGINPNKAIGIFLLPIRCFPDVLHLRGVGHLKA